MTDSLKKRFSMEIATITNVVIFLVFVAALMVFSLSPAIWICEKLSSRFVFIDLHSNKITILLTLIFSMLATLFIFLF
jgi:hypothetical protein